MILAAVADQLGKKYSGLDVAELKRRWAEVPSDLLSLSVVLHELCSESK